MRLKKTEREFFRKRLENFFVKNPQIKQCEVVDHFVKEGIARQTVYNALNRRKNGQPILEEKRLGRPSSWASSLKAKLKRLVNNRKEANQRNLDSKFNKHFTTKSRQIKKIGINNYPRELTPKHTEESALKAKKRSRKLVNLLYRSGAEVIMDDEKYFCFDVWQCSILYK